MLKRGFPPIIVKMPLLLRNCIYLFVLLFLRCKSLLYFSSAKVRRLYDIANILSSMELIEKNPTYFGSRKAAFKWIGVDLDSLEPDTGTQ